MYYEPTLGGGLFGAFRFLGDVAFRWIPGTVEVMSGAVPDAGPTPVLTPITQPLTTTDVTNFLQTAAAPSSFDHLEHDWAIWVTLSIMISLLLGAGVIYCIIRIFQIRATENANMEATAHPVAAKDVSKAQLRWNRILEQLQSDNERDWRLAILEADILLNELLDVLAYRGDTMADKMKQVDRADFKTIDLAWEGHRVRNQIAHQGSLQDLTQREAKRVIGLYERVFREFKFVE